MIELASLRKTFGDTVALEEIDLSVPAGEIHGIVGRSGAGKSTLIRCLTGLERPSSGTVAIDGTDITDQSGSGLREARRSIGMVFQHVNLLDSRTA
ncbi:MAG: ATP-binding cassette domain-containing protein, partial [Brevibacterium aurantiacum]|nr:ATP-binding cassette domain-containing protein [Brevibacterium aurantiacum]